MAVAAIPTVAKSVRANAAKSLPVLIMGSMLMTV